ncbi:phage tail protein [Salmonella enterica]|nr:phage tail protein [Salmonella enterica]EEH5260634.1 phage tail protein [Salmonella enterica]
MFHLDNNSGISAMPKPAAQQSSATRWFTEGGGNNSPSWPGQDWFNIVQAELLNVLTTAGIAPEKTAFNQLALAIKAIINKDALLKGNLLSEIRAAGASSQKTARENLDITDATLNKKGLTQLSNAVDSTSEAQSATAKAVKIAMDNANARLAKDRNGADIPNVALFLQNVGLIETINLAAGALQKSQNGGDIPDKDLFVRRIGAARAFDGAATIGGDANSWTTEEFIAWLESQGAFNHPYWMCRGTWSYALNKVITDTGCGNICLAGAVIEVMGVRGAMTIRVTTPTTTSGGGIASAQFTYINNGEGYAPGWRREFSRTGDEMTGNLYLKNDGRVNFCIMNEDGTPRMWIFKDKGSDGIHINNGNDGGGDFIFGKDGNFRAGAAIYANNGDAFGTAWGGGNAAWLSGYLYLNMVKAIRLGPVALSGGLWRDFQLGGGQVVTGFHTDGDWEMQGGDDKVYYRPIQYLIGTQWVTAPSV